MVFTHDDYVPIENRQIHFVNDQVAYMYMGWMYAVTIDSGLSWHIWDGNRVELFSKDRIGYSGIQTIIIDHNGQGKMLLQLIGFSNPVELQTDDFGVSWHVQKS